MPAKVVSTKKFTIKKTYVPKISSRHFQCAGDIECQDLSLSSADQRSLDNWYIRQKSAKRKNVLTNLTYKDLDREESRLLDTVAKTMISKQSMGDSIFDFCNTDMQAQFIASQHNKTRVNSRYSSSSNITKARNHKPLSIGFSKLDNDRLY